MTGPIPVPEWCKPGAPAYIKGPYGSITPVTIDRITRTQVIVRYRGTIERRFSIKRDLYEVGGDVWTSDVWTSRRLVSPEDPGVRDRVAKDTRRQVWAAVEEVGAEWIDTGDLDALESAIRVLTEEAPR